MLNWEYDADAERRVLTEEAEQRGEKRGLKKGLTQGEQRGAELVVKLIKEGMSVDEALEKVTSASSTDKH